MPVSVRTFGGSVVEVLKPRFKGLVAVSDREGLRVADGPHERWPPSFTTAQLVAEGKEHTLKVLLEGDSVGRGKAEDLALPAAGRRPSLDIQFHALALGMPVDKRLMSGDRPCDL